MNEELVVNNLPTLRFEMCPQGIGTLIGALAKAQKAFKPVRKTSQNPFYKSSYADLAEVLDATRDALADNSIAVIQPPCFRKADGTVEIYTLMGHSSGEWIKSILELPIAKHDAQGVGAGITYGRRYAYSGTVNVASEEDDDGNGAVSKEFKKPAKEETNDEFDQRTADQQAIAVFQIQAIDEACKRTGKTEAEVLAYLGLIGHKRIEHVLKSQFNEFIKWANSTGKPKSKGPAPDAQARIAANKKLWAAAAEFSIPEGDVKTCAYEKYKVQSMNDLTTDQLNDMAAWVKEVASAATR